MKTFARTEEKKKMEQVCQKKGERNELISRHVPGNNEVSYNRGRGGDVGRGELTGVTRGERGGWDNKHH